MADYTYDSIRKSKEEDKNLNKQLDNKLSANNTLYKNNAQTITDTFTQQIEESNSAYEDDYRENAVQKKVNEFYIAEEMANMGLTNSGLNRTQITANQLSYSNQKAEIDRQRQSMVDQLTLEMNSRLTENENARLSQEQEIRDTDSQYRDSLALSEFTTRTEADTARYKAEQEALAEITKSNNDYNLALQKAQISANTKLKEKEIDTLAELPNKQSEEAKNLYSHLQDNSGDSDYSAQLINSYCQKYDIDPRNDATVATLLKAAELNINDLTNYGKTGTVYMSNAEYNKSETKGTKVKWDYKTAGKQDYKIKVVKDTWNLFGGVDGNAIVNIYYPDGTLLKENVKLGSLSRNNGLKISALTKGSGNKNRTETLSLDLSKEKLY